MSLEQGNVCRKSQIINEAEGILHGIDILEKRVSEIEDRFIIMLIPDNLNPSCSAVGIAKEDRLCEHAEKLQSMKNRINVIITRLESILGRSQI